MCTARFNIHKFCVLPAQCTYVFCKDLRSNSNYLFFSDCLALVDGIDIFRNVCKQLPSYAAQHALCTTRHAVLPLFQLTRPISDPFGQCSLISICVLSNGEQRTRACGRWNACVSTCSDLGTVGLSTRNLKLGHKFSLH